MPEEDRAPQWQPITPICDCQRPPRAGGLVDGVHLAPNRWFSRARALAPMRDRKGIAVRGIGTAGLILGALLMLIGLFGDTTVSGSGGLGRMHNIGLLGAHAGMIAAGSGLMVSGAIFYVGGALQESLQAIRISSTAPGASARPASMISAATVPTAASSASAAPNPEVGAKEVPKPPARKPTADLDALIAKHGDELGRRVWEETNMAAAVGLTLGESAALARARAWLEDRK